MHTLIEQQMDLLEVTSGLNGAQLVALDMEADSFHHYRPKVCLIQITFSGRNCVIDPLAPLDMTAFMEALSSKDLILHDAGYDLRMLNADFGFVPKGTIFDTMIAAGLAGMKNVGLSAMMHEVLGAPTAKQHQKADWSKRPLADYLLNYAAEDTKFLFQIKEYLEAKLKDLGRLEWHEESCRNAIKMALAVKEPHMDEDQWRIKSSGTLKPKEMVFLKQLWYWRDDIARKTNIAPFMILRNEDMMKLAIWGAHLRKPVEDDTEFPIRHARRYSQSLLKAFRSAQDILPEDWPGPRKADPSQKLSEKNRRIVNQLKDECEVIAQSLDLPLSLIASRQSLTRIVLGKASTLEQIRQREILLNWQATLLLPAIQKVLV